MTDNAGATYRTPLIALAALIALPFVMWGGLTWQTGRALQAELNKVRAAGAPLTMAQVAPPPVPDNQNAALLYVKAFRYLRPGTALGQTYRDLAREENPARRRQFVAQLRPLLAGNRTALDLAARGARLSASRLPVDWARLDPLTSTAVFINYTGRFRELARLFAMQAEVASADGRVEEAMQSCLIGVRMGDHVSGEPDFVMHLTGRAVQAIALGALARVLKQHRVSPALCADASKQLGQIDVQSPLRLLLQEQRVEGLAALDYIERHPGEITLEPRPSPGTGSSGWFIEAFTSRIGLPLRRSERVYYLRLMDRLITLLPRPYREIHSQLDDIGNDAEYAPPGYLLMPYVFVPSSLPMHRDTWQARIDGVRIVLALKAYQAAYGAYPDSLAALRKYLGGASAAPEGRRSRIQGWKPPKDPFSGKDFGYRRNGSGFMLYSWGEDLKDDGGRPVPNPARTDPPDGDIVWTFGK